MKQKLIALVCALALAVGLVGCSLSTPDSVGTIGNVDISSGLYLLAQFDAYQTAADLYNIVTDGIAILKVGPALTYGLREALFSLSMMEKELVPEEKRASFIETLDAVMLASPANWEKHYHGDEKHLAQCRKYSYSDRARYYIGQPEVVAAMNKLFDNLREYPIPMNMLHQYMPISYAKIREGKLKLDPRELAMDGIVQFMLDYESAV